MTQFEPFRSLLLAHLEEDNGLCAKSSLEAYFFERAYTGSSFENFCGREANNFTASDIVAVSMLSVNIPPAASRWILNLGKEDLSIHLNKIEPKLSIEHPDADLSKGSHAWNLWNKIHSLSGVGETMASKLLAAKRPLLFPIYDQHVAKALQLSPNAYWQPWQTFMRSEDGRRAVTIVKHLAKNLDRPDISPLRLLDIVVWMREHGHKFITTKLVSEGKMICVKYADPY
jgi:hypothetical protein